MINNNNDDSDRVRELLIECLMRYGGKVNKEAYKRHKQNQNKDE